MFWYYKLLAQRPHLILVFIATFCVACIVVSLTTKRFPDFSDPTLGFEARGTELGQRMTAWHNLLDETRPLGRLVANPYEYVDYDEFGGTFKQRPRKQKGNRGRHWKRKQNRKQDDNGKKRGKLQLTDKIKMIKQNASADTMQWDSDEEEISNWTDGGDGRGRGGGERHWEYGRNISFLTDEVAANKSIQLKKENWMKLTKMYPPPDATDNTSSDGFFCESPNKGYSHFVMERINYNVNESLFDINAILAMCDLEQRLIWTDSYGDYCVREIITNECCRPWSLANYVALLANKTHCFDIVAADVDYVSDLLLNCFAYYHDLRLSNDCVNLRCKNVPIECTQFNAVYNIFHYLTDIQFMAINDTKLFLRNAVVFLPIAKSTKILPFYKNLIRQSLQNQLINIPAMDMGLKNALFDACLISDGWLVVLSGIFVIFCMCFYTASICITTMTIVAVIFSLGVSYFFYKFIFELTFFPFMNILAVIVLVGIGADNAFVFIKMWQCSIAEKVKASGVTITAPAAVAVAVVATTSSAVDNDDDDDDDEDEEDGAGGGGGGGDMERSQIQSADSSGHSGSRYIRCLFETEDMPTEGRVKRTSAGASEDTNYRIRTVARGHKMTDTLAGLFANTLQSAALSMAVTSMTTAAAFYASTFSSITAVRCFGIFAGTAVLINYILMVTWLPAAVSIAERLSCPTLLCGKLFSQRWHRTMKVMRDAGDKVENYLISVIVSMPLVWIILFGLVGILSGVVVFYWPRLQLPRSPDFKLFVSSHPFEIYDLHFKNQFWFEKNFTSVDSFQLPLRFVWGIEPVDDGQYLDPTSRGEMILDPQFNISLPESQEWLLQFCKSVREQPFYESSFGGIMPNCFIENFYEFMRRRCFDKMADIDRSPCCENTTRPYAPYIFDKCLPHSISSLYATPRELFIPGLAGPKFRRTMDNNNDSFSTHSDSNNDNYNANANVITSDHPIDGRPPALVAAVVVEFDSTQSNSIKSYDKVRDFVAAVEKWFREQLKDAPVAMRKAFFVSELDFYDLQNTLSRGTWTAVWLSMAIAWLVLFLVTLNVVISIYAIITVTMTICATVAVLVAAGWELNVLESVAVSTIIGLAVDYSLHYGVHYRFSPDRTRVAAARFSLRRMMGPTAMAATTTAAAGAFMLPSQVLAYIQIGLFLVIVMVISWLYATFFLMSLLMWGGPEYGYGQFEYPNVCGWLCCRKRHGLNSGSNTGSCGGGGGAGGMMNKQMDKSCGGGINPVSEQLLSGSSSAVGDMVGSESHELDSLTSNSIVKPPTHLECSQPINFDRAFKKSGQVQMEQSPTISAITMVMPDDGTNE